MAEEHRGFYSPSWSSVLFQDLHWSVPNRSLNSQSDDNKAGSSTHLLDISSFHSSWKQSWTVLASPPHHQLWLSGSSLCCFSLLVIPPQKPWCCMIPHTETPLFFRVVSLMDQVREISPPNEFREPPEDVIGNVDSPQQWHHCSSPSSSSQTNISIHHPTHHGRYELMPVLHQNHTE